MATTINVHEAKTNLSKLLVRVASGEEIIIAKSGKPVAKLVPISKEAKTRVPGSAKGKILIEKEFDSPLPEEILRAFEE